MNIRVGTVLLAREPGRYYQYVKAQWMRPVQQEDGPMYETQVPAAYHMVIVGQEDSHLFYDSFATYDDGLIEQLKVRRAVPRELIEQEVQDGHLIYGGRRWAKHSRTF